MKTKIVNLNVSLTFKDEVDTENIDRISEFTKQIIQNQYNDSDIGIDMYGVAEHISVSESKTFPNGFRSWMETHHEFVSLISYVLDKWNANNEENKVSQTLKLYSEGGCTEMYDYAEKLTDDFEAENKGRQWDGDFFDDVERYFQAKDKI